MLISKPTVSVRTRVRASAGGALRPLTWYPRLRGVKAGGKVGYMVGARVRVRVRNGGEVGIGAISSGLALPLPNSNSIRGDRVGGWR